MIFVIIWLFDHFPLQPVPSVNGFWIITFVNHPHAWVTEFKPPFMFFQLSILTSNNVIWLSFSTILFDETQHVVKTSMTGYVPICYEIINLFIEPKNFLLMFFICKLKGFHLIVTACDGLLMVFLHFFCKLLSKMRKQHIVAVFSEVFWLCLLTWNTISYISSSLVQISYFWECFGQSTDFPLRWHYSFDTSGRSLLNYKRPLQYQGSFCYIQVPYTLPWRVSRVFYWRSQRIIPLH